MKNNKKILIAYQYLSFKGGIEHVIISQAHYLQEAGYDVQILTSAFDTEEKNTIEGITVTRIPSFNFAYKKFGIPFAIPILTPKNSKQMKALITDSDIVNVHGHPYFASFIYIWLSKQVNVPVILTQHNTKIHATSRLVNSICDISDATLGKYNLLHSDGIIAVSQKTKEYMQTILGKKGNNIDVLYNGIDVTRFSPIKDKKKLREKYTIPLDSFICLTIRRMTFKNGIDILLEVAKHTKNKHIHFLLGGVGPETEKIKKYIADNAITNVSLLGFIRDSELPEYYSLSDLYILPSRDGEGFPMTILEAFACGLPVLATKSGGHVEIITEDKTGFLVETNNYKKILEKLEYLAQNTDQLPIISKNCRQLMMQDFTWEKNKKGFISKIEEVMANAVEK